MSTSTIVIILLLVAFGLFYLSKKAAGDVMDPEEAKKQIEDNSGVVIDVRTPAEYSNTHLKKARHNIDVSSGNFKQKIQSLDKDKSYYLYCRSGRRSGKAKQIMEQNGFEDVHNIGGIQSLINAGFTKN